MDSTFEFEKRRNVPVRYDRNLVSTTLKVMKRVEEISAARGARYHERRMEAAKALRVKQDVTEINKGGRLLAPAEKELVETTVQERVAQAAGVALTEGAAAAAAGAGGSSIQVEDDGEDL